MASVPTRFRFRQTSAATLDELRRRGLYGPVPAAASVVTRAVRRVLGYVKDKVKRTPTPTRGISRRPRIGGWTLDEIVEYFQGRSEAAKRADIRWHKGHRILIPPGGFLASRRWLGELFHLSKSWVQVIITRLVRAGGWRLILGTCDPRVCHGKKHEHTSVLVRVPNRCAEVISRAVLNASGHGEEKQTIKQLLDQPKVISVLKVLSDPGIRTTAFDRDAAERFVSRNPGVDPWEVAGHLLVSPFLQGKVPGRRGRFAGLTVAWVLDHARDIAAGRYDRWIRSAEPEVKRRPVVYRDVGTIAEYQARQAGRSPWHAALLRRLYAA